jgi:ATP:ADP antiporter, AAA family
MKVLQFALLGLLLQAGLTVGINAGDSLFLARVGADKLPHIYILVPLLMLLYIPTVTAMLRRFGIDRVLDATMAVLVAGGAVFWLCLAHWAEAPPVALCYAAKLYASLWFVGLYTLFWSYLDDFFDLMDAKRLFALFAAGSACGDVLGGAICSFRGADGGIGSLYLWWSAFALAAWPVLLATRRQWKRVETDATAGDGGGSMAALVSLWHSRYATALALALFLILVTSTLCEYQFMTVFSEGRDEAGISTLLGTLTFGVNACNLFITLLLFNPLVTRFGVRNVAVLQPVAFVIVFCGLVFQPGMVAAIAAFAACRGLMMAVDFNNYNLLYSGLPSQHRTAVRTLIEGVGEPAASAATGVFLLFIAPLFSVTQLSMMGGGSAFAVLFTVLVVRHDYASAIANNIRNDWFDLARRPLWLPTPSAQAIATTTEQLLSVLPKLQGRRRETILNALTANPDPTVVAPVLALAADFTPAERRQAEQMFVAVGTPAIGELVDAAGSSRHSLRARSIAMRALGKLDLSKFQSVSQPLMLRTARRAYEMLGRRQAIAQLPDSEAVRVLTRIYSDYGHLVVGVVLEALTISGRLPPYEAIDVALSGRSKERGFAMETIEQGAGRPLYRLLAPLLGDHTPDRQTACGRTQGLVPVLSARDALEAARTAAFPLEAAAALQALWALGERDGLVAADSRQTVRQTIEVLRAREDGDSTRMTPVDCVAVLMAAPAFSMFDFTHLEWLAPHLKVQCPDSGAVLAVHGEVMQRIHVVVGGVLLRRCGGDTLKHGDGTVVGALLNAPRAEATWLAGDNLKVITMERTAIFACTEVFPALGLELLRRMVSG